MNLRMLVLGGALVLALPPVQAQSLGDYAKGLMSKNSGVASSLPDADIGTALKQALSKGTKVAVNQLGHTDGFWNDPKVRIPLPGPVEKIEGVLKGTKMGGQVDDLHLSINRAAEEAVPVAANVFGEAVQKLSLQDVRGILNGPQDAATQYFKRTTSDTLTAQFKPIVSRVTAKSGLVQKYNAVTAGSGPLTQLLSSKESFDLDGYVTGKALDGLFYEVAQEEKAIRTDPAARTTELMKKVFGGG